MSDTLKYEDLSAETKETIEGMIVFCLNQGYCMGMDHGVNEDDTKHKFRQELESFVDYENQ